MRRFGIAAALVLLAVAAGGCARLEGLRQTWEAAKEIVVSEKAVVLAVSLSRAAERTGTVYLGQRKCPVGVQRPTCRSPAITETIATAMTEMRKARDELLDFVETHPCPETGSCPIGAQGLYDAMRGATGTLKSIFATYKIGG